MANNNEPTLFTFLNQIQTKDKKFPYDKKIANAYMLSQFLSMDKNLINKVNDINKYQYMLKDEVIYNYYMDVISKGKRYLKFVKKTKEHDKIKKQIEQIKEENPDMSIRECRMALQMINKN